MSDNYEIWTTDEVMDYLLVGRNTLYNLLRKGKIKGFKKIGRASCRERV